MQWHRSTYYEKRSPESSNCISGQVRLVSPRVFHNSWIQWRRVTQTQIPESQESRQQERPDEGRTGLNLESWNEDRTDRPHLNQAPKKENDSCDVIREGFKVGNGSRVESQVEPDDELVPVSLWQSARQHFTSPRVTNKSNQFSEPEVSVSPGGPEPSPKKSNWPHLSVKPKGSQGVGHSSGVVESADEPRKPPSVYEF